MLISKNPKVTVSNFVLVIIEEVSDTTIGKVRVLSLRHKNLKKCRHEHHIAALVFLGLRIAVKVPRVATDTLF